MPECLINADLTQIMNPEKVKLPLIAEVNMACDNLGLVRAELARILGLMCQDVSDSRVLEQRLRNNSDCQQYAIHFVTLYAELEKCFQHNNVAMINWFRKHNVQLGTTPFLAIVDSHRLLETITALKAAQ